MNSPATPASITQPTEEVIFNWRFWCAFAANCLLVAANTLTFRFAELINFLGGSEQQSGFIVSVGIVISLIGRLWIGQLLDNYGCRLVWVLSTICYLIGVGLIMTATNIGWEMYLGRTLFALAIAGGFTCSNVHIQLRCPPHRRTEMIGTIGSSGFLGLILGSQSGDLILSLVPGYPEQFYWLFGLSIAMAVVYLFLVIAVTWGDVYEKPEHSRGGVGLLVSYWPGWIVLVAMMMGMGFAVTTVFLTRYATSLGLKGIGTFFTAYAITAFTVRVTTRSWSRIYGRYRLIMIGLFGHFAGFTLLLFISQEWHFAIPGFCCGFAHALLFPSVISLASGTFPAAYRGTGTTFALGFLDLGNFVAAPLVGYMIDHIGYAPMFLTTAFTALITAALFYWRVGHHPDTEESNAQMVAEPKLENPPIPEETFSLSNEQTIEASQQHVTK